MQIVCLFAMRSSEIQSTSAEQIKLERYILGHRLIVDTNYQLLAFLLEEETMPFAVVVAALVTNRRVLESLEIEHRLTVAQVDSQRSIRMIDRDEILILIAQIRHAEHESNLIAATASCARRLCACLVRVIHHEATRVHLDHAFVGARLIARVDARRSTWRLGRLRRLRDRLHGTRESIAVGEHLVDKTLLVVQDLFQTTAEVVQTRVAR